MSQSQEAVLSVMSDVVMYGQAATVSVAQIVTAGHVEVSAARVSPPCLVIRGGVVGISHQPLCGCGPLQPVTQP